MKNNRGRNKSFIVRVDKGRCCPMGGFDYKAIGILKRYIAETGKIESGKRMGNCAKCQRNLTTAIKRARHMALIPFASNHRYDTSLISLPKNDTADSEDAVASQDADTDLTGQESQEDEEEKSNESIKV